MALAIELGTRVSIHAPTGGATNLPYLTCEDWSFNSRAHGGRDIALMLVGMTGCVSIHAPTGGATYGVIGHITEIIVSIHAPTGGATVNLCTADDIAGVSIHAPTGGATERGRRHGGDARFQFTRPRGARHRGVERKGQRERVSIHAPTGGATIFCL